MPTTSAEYRACADSACASATTPRRSRNDVAKLSSASAAATALRVRDGQRAGDRSSAGRGPFPRPRVQRIGDGRAELDASFDAGEVSGERPGIGGQPRDRGRDGAARAQLGRDAFERVGDRRRDGARPAVSQRVQDHRAADEDGEDRHEREMHVEGGADHARDESAERPHLDDLQRGSVDRRVVEHRARAAVRATPASVG